MKKAWAKLSELSRYYILSMTGFLVLWGLFLLLSVEFVNVLFFMTAYIWHFTLLTPGLRDKMMRDKQRFSFISVVVRVNYYLQLFIKFNRFNYGPSFIRALSPFLFTFMLIMVGGSGNLFFTLFGSVAFELIFAFCFKAPLEVQQGSDEIPPAIPREESVNE